MCMEFWLSQSITVLSPAGFFEPQKNYSHYGAPQRESFEDKSQMKSVSVEVTDTFIMTYRDTWGASCLVKRKTEMSSIYSLRP